MRFPHAVIATDKRSQRNLIWRGESRIPAGAMLHRFDSLAISALVTHTKRVAGPVLSRLGMLPWLSRAKK